MKIVVDQNVPLGNLAFAQAGAVVRLAGRSIRRSDMDGCHALIVRSITKVDRSLLEGTPVRFVGTCTIGTDHLDIPWLESNGIEWVSAPGCNARSVAEWVGSVLASMHLQRRTDLSQSPTSGVIGVGRVGKQVAKVLAGLVGAPLLNDPPRARQEGPDGYSSLSDLVETCQIVCAHLPLTRQGEDATYQLLTKQVLSKLRLGSVFLNAGRGPTAVSPDLLALLNSRADLTMALDVFDPEPSIPVELARRAHFISPHVAGYSLEGKLEGTRMVREALGNFLGLPRWDLPEGETSPLWIKGIRLPDKSQISPASDPWDALCALIQAAWSPEEDDTRLRATLELGESARGEAFDRLRREYPTRLEWRHRPIQDPALLPEATRIQALKLGFVGV